MCLDTTLATGLRDGSAIAHLLVRGGGLSRLRGILGTCHALKRHCVASEITNAEHVFLGHTLFRNLTNSSEGQM